MRTLDELGIIPAPWFARLGVMEGDFVNSGTEDNEDGEVCAVSLHGCDLKQSHANARLIAAAPNLYKCLREACEWERACGWDYGINDAMITRWESVLAAASGESEGGGSK